MSPHMTLSHTDCRGNLDISGDGLRARYRGSVGHADEREKNVGTVKATMPVPGSGVAYFEATILNPGSTGEIGIGFVTAEHRLSDLPGWGSEERGWGYHADDGAVVIGGRVLYANKKLPSTYTTRDVVGCGLRWGENGGTAFFTKNGVLLGGPLTEIERQEFFPAVGILSTAGEVYVNFGQENFVFNIGGYVQDPKHAHKHEAGLKDISHWYDA